MIRTWRERISEERSEAEAWLGAGGGPAYETPVPARKREKRGDVCFLESQSLFGADYMRQIPPFSESS